MEKLAGIVSDLEMKHLVKSIL